MFHKKFVNHLKYAALFFVLALSACSRDQSSDETKVENTNGFEKTELVYQGYAGAVAFPELAEDLGYLAPLKLKYVGNITGGPQDLQALATGDVDFATAFNGAIIKLAASGVPIVTLVASYGSDENTGIGFYVTEDSPIKSARDLIGKKIGVNTLGAHSEFTIKEYLYRNGLTKDEVDKVELLVVPPVNTEQILRAKQIDAGQLQSILLDKAKERGGIRPLFVDTDLFGNFTAGNYTVTKKFLAENPNTSRKFVEATARAIEWARKTPREEVIARYISIVNKRGRNESAEPIKYWKSTGIANAGGVIEPIQYQQWIDWLVREGELKPNQIKATDLFDNSLNPYANGQAVEQENPTPVSNKNNQ